MAPSPKPSATVWESRKEKYPAQVTRHGLAKPQAPPEIAYLVIFKSLEMLWMVQLIGKLQRCYESQKIHNQIKPVAKGINFKITL